MFNLETEIILIKYLISHLSINYTKYNFSSGLKRFYKVNNKEDIDTYFLDIYKYAISFNIYIHFSKKNNCLYFDLYDLEKKDLFILYMNVREHTESYSYT
jgi:hypothetical protein